jgi:hypothetical protein
MANVLVVIGLLFVYIAAYAVLAALPVMWLWNWLMPYLFNLPTISFWQSFGLLVLCGALFKSSSSSSKS